jgi:selenocysteine lyase/cysteine desulfurase
VEYASVQLLRHELRPGEAAFEDGTPNFLGIAALASGFEFRDLVGIDRAAMYVRSLTGMLLDGLLAMTHPDGRPLVRIYGPPTLCMRGGIVTFNVLSADDGVVPFEIVETLADERGVFLRGGCFCNPGAAEAAFAFQPAALARALDGLSSGFSIAGLRSRLGRTPVGAVRASLGVANSPADVERALSLVEEFRNR